VTLITTTLLIAELFQEDGLSCSIQALLDLTLDSIIKPLKPKLAETNLAQRQVMDTLLPIQWQHTLLAKLFA
jgi:hypothetical protein